MDAIFRSLLATASGEGRVLPGEGSAEANVAGGAEEVALEPLLDGLFAELRAKSGADAADRPQAAAAGGPQPAAGGPQAAAGAEATTRPQTLLNMVSTADGRATIGGRSGPIGNDADRQLFHGLRTVVDAVMVGAQTLRLERYNRIVADAAARARRRRRGLEPEPWACVVTGSMNLDTKLPLLADDEARVIVLTPSQGTLPACAARVEYVRAERDGELDLLAAMRTLRERFAIERLLCEGGPHLAGELVAGAMLDELFLTLAPKIVAGDIASSKAGTRGTATALQSGAGSALPTISGAALDPPAPMRLRWVLESDSYLFLRYALT